MREGVHMKRITIALVAAIIATLGVAAPADARDSGWNETRVSR